MSYESTETETSGRHPINVGQLVMGIAFLGLVGIWAAIEADIIEGGDIRWLLPVPWVLAGAAGLLAIALGGRRRAAGAEQPAYQSYAAQYSAQYSAPYAAPYSAPHGSTYSPASGEDTDVPSAEHDTDVPSAEQDPDAPRTEQDPDEQKESDR